MPTGLPGSPDQDKRIIRIAVLLSVLLHVVLLIGLKEAKIGPDAAALARLDREREIEVFLEPAPEMDAADAANQPERIALIPERHAAEAAPEDPDFLAQHHSVAADNKLGDGNQPSADEEGEIEQVAIAREELAGAAGVQYTAPPVPQNQAEAAEQQSGAAEGRETASEGDKQTPDGQWALPDETQRTGGETDGQSEEKAIEDKPVLEEWWNGPESPSILKEGDQAAVGDRGFDFNQKAIGKTTSGVVMVDDFQLNTVEWDWAPWIQVFANELHRHWVSPYAYRLGLINGTTVIRLVVEKNGRPSSMEILAKDGHESLHDASLAALKAFAPYRPLPAHFPEENLVITLSLHYPAFRR